MSWRSPQLKEKPLRLSIYYYSMNYALTNKEGLLSANKSSLAILLIAFALLLAACSAGSSITPVEQINVGEAVRQMALAPDGAMVVTLSGETTVSAWDVVSGEKKYSLPAAGSYVTAIAISPDGKTLAVGEKSGAVTLRELADGTELRSLDGQSEAVSSLAFTKDGALIAAGGGQGTIWLWQTADGTEHSNSPMKFPAPLASLAFSPRDDQLAASMWFNGSVILMDVTTGDGKVLTEYENATQSVTPMGPSVWKIAFTPDGKQLATVGEDNKVHLWQVPEGTPGLTFSGPADFVNSIAFSADGKKLAAGSDDLTATVWDAASGALLSTLSGHSGEVTGVAFLPGGKYLATASSDGTLRFWDWEAEE